VVVVVDTTADTTAVAPGICLSSLSISHIKRN
jgi:hypothetical protein